MARWPATKIRMALKPPSASEKAQKRLRKITGRKACKGELVHRSGSNLRCVRNT